MQIFNNSIRQDNTLARTSRKLPSRFIISNRKIYVCSLVRDTRIHTGVTILETGCNTLVYKDDMFIAYGILFELADAAGSRIKTDAYNVNGSYHHTIL